jgi:hypothetical protein
MIIFFDKTDYCCYKLKGNYRKDRNGKETYSKKAQNSIHS